jgi:hypothetical protein
MPVETDKFGKDLYRDHEKFPFGQYKDVPFRDVDPEYLLYIYDLPWIKTWPGVELYISKNFDTLLKRQTMNRKSNRNQK